MRYYVTKDSVKKLGFTWDLSLYKVTQTHTEVIRFYPNGRITKGIIQRINFDFIYNHCKEIYQEEYEQMLEL